MLAQLCECLYRGYEAHRLLARQTHHDAPHDDVVVPSGIDIHAQHDVCERCNPATEGQLALHGLIDAREHAQQRGFASAVRTNQADPIPRTQQQAHITQRMHADLPQTAGLHTGLVTHRKPQHRIEQAP